MTGPYYLFVLTGWHVYTLGVHAKLIWHCTTDSQVCSRHNFELVCYLSIDKGTLIKLNSKRNTNIINIIIWYSIWFYTAGITSPPQHLIKCTFSTTRGGCWIAVRPLQDPSSMCLWDIDTWVWEENLRHKDKLPTPFPHPQYMHKRKWRFWKYPSLTLESSLTLFSLNGHKRTGWEEKKFECDV